MNTPTPEARRVHSRSQMRRLQIQGDIAKCATCGKIARVQDSVTAAAIYSVAIESPTIMDMLCECHDD